MVFLIKRYFPLTEADIQQIEAGMFALVGVNLDKVKTEGDHKHP